jgi:deoxycytidylate deaminase
MFAELMNLAMFTISSTLVLEFVLSKKRFDITAIVYDKRGRVLSIGKNSYVKTHPHMAFHAAHVGLPEKQFLHAEVHAIVKCRDLKKAHKIVVLRYDSEGNPKNAKPCPVCESAIRASGIKIVEHT